MKPAILLGFELKTGAEVYVKLHHLVVTGMTGESGKTTTLEALLTRGQLTGLAFRTKRGELGFEKAHRIPAYFSEEGLTQWRALEGLLSATLGEKVQREPGVRAAIIRLCSGTRTLDEVHQRNRRALEKAKGFQRDVHEKINAYLDLVIPQLKEAPLSDELALERGRLNVMDLEGYSEELQNLIIFASTEHIYHVEKDVILVVPEAAKFIPEGRGSPCKVAIEKYVREGRSVGNYLWIDSQDMRGVDKRYLRHCDNWLLGRQRLMLEVEASLDSIPLPKHLKPKPEDLQQLEIGQFIACLHNDVKRVYVQPAWLGSAIAKNVALGKIKPPEKTFVMPPPPQEQYRPQASKATIADSFKELEARGTIREILHNEWDPKLDRITERINAIAATLADMARPKITAPTLAVKVEEGKVADIRKAVDLEHVETTYRISHKETEARLSTTTQKGQVLYALINDLEGKSSTILQIAAAMAEYGWDLTNDVIRLNLLKLSKEGYVVPPAQGRPAGGAATYRTPSKVKIIVKHTP